ncbi:MAG: ferredoxin--NADP reductase [Vicinamibacterales bacterium]
MPLVLPARHVIRATPRTRIIQLELGDQPLAFQAGQAVMAGLPGSPVRKPYSIACSPGQAARDRLLELLVQVDDTGSPDPHLERVIPGGEVAFEGPFGTFVLDAPPAEPAVIFLAGGTGIAPLRAMLWRLLEQDWGGRVALLYSARAPEEFAYREELEALAAEGRIELGLTVTRARDGWAGVTGRIDRRLVEGILAGARAHAYLCGPRAFVADAAALLLAAGVPAAAIDFERFA